MNISAANICAYRACANMSKYHFNNFHEGKHFRPTPKLGQRLLETPDVKNCVFGIDELLVVSDKWFLSTHFH